MATAASMKARGAALLAGVVPALALPEIGWWAAALVGLVPLLHLVASAPSAKEAVVRSWLGGSGYFLAAAHWLAPKVGPGLPAIAALLASTWCLWGYTAWELLKVRPSLRGMGAALLVVPAAWISGEVIRSWEHLGGPWALLGSTQWANRPLLRLASLGGVWLVGFVVVAANVAAYFVVRRRSRFIQRAAGLLAILLMLSTVLAYNALRPDGGEGHVARIAVVQPGIIESPERRFDVQVELTERLPHPAADLIVWGESSVAETPFKRADFVNVMTRLAEKSGAPILINVDARRDQGGIYKSSVLVADDGVVGRYDKMRMVPFGEYIPLRPALGWLSGISDAASEDRRRGNELTTLDAGRLLIGPLVCFESSFPDLTRELASMGADVIVVQSATTTFQDSWAPEQHAALAAFRAVESGRPVVHATLSGVSSAYDADGRRILSVPTGARGAYVASVPLSRFVTPFVKLGDWVPWGSAAAVAAWLLGRRLRGNRVSFGTLRERIDKVQT
ncbi:MAG: apolipoprotein N-acyltransferase [Actinomycetota bacterium]|nr:apolipoprotein N-acyltransferase [Actinomycetota bacterium]